MLIRDDLEFHDSVMRGAMELRSLEQAHIIAPALVPHESIDIPGWRRRLPR